MEREEHGPLGADAALGGHVPAHENLVVPQPELPAPEVAARVQLLGAASLSSDMQQLTPLAHADHVRVEDLLAVLPRLPAGPPLASQVELPGLATREFVEGDAEGVGDRLGRAEGRLRLTGLVAADLA